MRIRIPFLLAALCLVASNWSGPILTWILLLSAFGLVLDGATKWWSRSGGLSQNRQ
jgi:hypothetical protein